MIKCLSIQKRPKKAWLQCLLVFCSLFLFACKATSQSPQQEPREVKNVILLIGDGMGLSQVSSSFYFGAQKEPNFARFPVIGLIKTSSAKQRITDSAAGATAFATGVKSYNGAIGVDVNKKRVENICERLEPKGIATGLVATSSITNATPACFYAHVTIRRLEDSIAYQMAGSGVDFFAGGGQKFFMNRMDRLNLIPKLEEEGYVINTNALPKKNKLDPDKKYGYLLSPVGMPSKLNGRGDFLVDATELALSYLSEQENGFFLMVEGSQIDWESHFSSVEGTIKEVRDFDKAIGAALDFAEKDGNTLVIVTADHETGGFALSPSLKQVPIGLDSTITAWNYDDIQGSFYDNSDTIPKSAAHTATLIPVFAYGPGAGKFGGIYENNEIFHKMMEIMGW